MEDESAHKNEAATGKIEPAGKKAQVVDNVLYRVTGAAGIILLISFQQAPVTASQSNMYPVASSIIARSVSSGSLLS